jgi:hypothetical protein
MKRSLCLANIIAGACAVLLLPAVALAGQQLSQAELLANATAVAEVHVAFLRQNKVRVEKVSWLAGKPPEAAKIRWDNGCLATRKALRSWLHQHRNWPKGTRQLWKRLRRHEGYQALVFLRPDRREPDVLAPRCEVELLNLKNVDIHPGYAKWRKSLIESIDERRGAAARSGPQSELRRR